MERVHRLGKRRIRLAVALGRWSSPVHLRDVRRPRSRSRARLAERVAGPDHAEGAPGRQAHGAAGHSVAGQPRDTPATEAGSGQRAARGRTAQPRPPLWPSIFRAHWPDCSPGSQTPSQSI